jgi:hypothetical protein
MRHKWPSVFGWVIAIAGCVLLVSAGIATQKQPWMRLPPSGGQINASQLVIAGLMFMGMGVFLILSRPK